MEAETLDRAPEVVRDLSEEERERAFAQHLLAIGMIDHIPEGYPEGYVDPPPIVVQGEPVSETVIRERR